MPSWSHTVTLDGGDITAETRLDSVMVEEAERESSIMDVVWRPAGGQQSGLALKPLVLTVDLGSGAVTLFSGKISRAVWAEKSETYHLRASTRIQEHFRALGTEAAVVAVFAAAGGASSIDFLGDPPDDLWEYAEQLLETLPYDCHIDRAGTRQLVAWAAKGTPDHSLDAGDVDNGGDVEWIEADTDTKTNQVILELGYSVQRWKTRAHTITWSFTDESLTNDFCSWIQGHTGSAPGGSGPAGHGYWPPPVLSQVEPVLQADSWSVPASVSAVQIPLDQSDLCFVGMSALEWYFERDSSPLTSAAATGYQAFSCEIQETYTITLDADGAQTVYGDTVTVRRTAALTVAADGNWPPQHVGAGSLTAPSTDTAGDSYVDQSDESRRADYLDTAYKWGRTALLDGQRQDGRRVRTVLRPDIDLTSTARINLFDLDTTGKVRRLRHTLAPLRTELTIAISRGGGSDDSYSTPARPDSSDPVDYWETEKGGAYSYPLPSAAHSIPTYVGSRPTSADKAMFDADEEGYFTNAVGYPGFGGDTDYIYDHVFRARWPDREEEATAGMAFPQVVTFEIATPSDPLVIG